MQPLSLGICKSRFARIGAVVIGLITVAALLAGLGAYWSAQREKKFELEQHSLVQAVAEKISNLSDKARADLDKTPGNFGSIMQAADDQLKQIDLTGCPQDFKEAVLDYISAMDTLLFRYSLMPNGFVEGFESSFEDLNAGRIYDATFNQQKEQYLQSCVDLQSAMVRLQKVTVEYDVN